VSVQPLCRRLSAVAATGLIAASATATPAFAGPAGAPESTAGSAGTAVVFAPLQAPAPAGDDVRAEQWHLKTLNVAGAWNVAAGQGVTVAVIDSGVDADHPDLQGQVLKGLDLVDDKGDGDTDLVGHGTTVAAIIAGKDDAGGVVGIAPKAKILPVRVLDQENRYDDAMIVAQGVRWAVDNGARVINLSLGGSGSSAALAAAIDYAFARDVVVVACTGNASASASTGVWYPAREPGVLAVAGMERDGDVLWSGSITGKETVVTAPATQLVGARPPTDDSREAAESAYWRVQGTSFAAPMVTATAALIRSRWPDMPAGEVVNRIIKTATDRGPNGRDNKFGFGMVNPTGALTAELPAVTLNPLDTNASPGISGFGSAPSDGQAQSAPDFLRPGTVDRVPGSNAGVAVAAPSPEPSTNGGWWVAAALFLLSGIVGVVVIRRFGSVH
jgi:serine protease